MTESSGNREKTGDDFFEIRGNLSETTWYQTRFAEALRGLTKDEKALFLKLQHLISEHGGPKGFYECGADEDPKRIKELLERALTTVEGGFRGSFTISGRQVLFQKTEEADLDDRNDHADIAIRVLLPSDSVTRGSTGIPTRVWSRPLPLLQAGQYRTRRRRNTQKSRANSGLILGNKPSEFS